MGYVTYLLNLDKNGSIEWLQGSLKFRPDAAKPVNAFAWKITRDSNGVVAVRALRDKRLVLIAHAKFLTTKLVDREQIGNEPTMHQWHYIEESMRMALAQRANAGADEDVISEPIDASELVGMKEAGPSYGQAIAQEVRREKQRKQRKQNDGRRVLIVLGIAVAASVAVYFAVGRSAKRTSSSVSTTSSYSTTSSTSSASSTSSTSHTDSASTPEPAVAVPVAPSRPATLAEVMAANPDLAVDSLASYTVRWSDVDVASQTTLAKVEKDPAAEHGKHVCAEGTIERITKTELAGRTHFKGVLVTEQGDRVAFVASGSSGELVKRDTAKLCGIVTGTEDGATAVFGMFDLPENRNPVVEKP